MTAATNRIAGKAFEKRIEDYLRSKGHIANRVPYSGISKNYGKGDLNAEINSLPFLVEAKKSRSGSITIKKEWLTKIKKEADSSDKNPLLIFGTLNSPLYAVIPLSDLLEIASGKEYI